MIDQLLIVGDLILLRLDRVVINVPLGIESTLSDSLEGALFLVVNQRILPRGHAVPHALFWLHVLNQAINIGLLIFSQ